MPIGRVGDVRCVFLNECFFNGQWNILFITITRAAYYLCAREAGEAAYLIASVLLRCAFARGLLELSVLVVAGLGPEPGSVASLYGKSTHVLLGQCFSAG